MLWKYIGFTKLILEFNMGITFFIKWKEFNDFFFNDKLSLGSKFPCFMVRHLYLNHRHAIAAGIKSASSLKLTLHICTKEDSGKTGITTTTLLKTKLHLINIQIL